ncbi:neuropeptide CCHamide-1 receptor-like [Limulus polyphemus]|uniref:Neuropeptide CCHamide-1 receptor-like n=1 Tax=Limulus polyphemus TaxID=6850 RepID=A0ABM1B7F5_LIMPO|nr:neuropeptide CCHamide-1 receptor-like [Limulus polyphemus]
MLTCIDDNRTCLNDSINTTVQYYDHIPYSVRPETYIVPALFVVIFLVGLIGNGTLIWMFFWNDDMHSVSNIFLMCLSVGDMIVILFTVPFVGTIYIFESWPYGEFVCKMSEFLCDLSEGVTILSLTVLSVDRYMVVSTPLRKQQTYHSKLLIIVVAMVIWVISIGLAIPDYESEVETDEPEDSKSTVLYRYHTAVEKEDAEYTSLSVQDESDEEIPEEETRVSSNGRPR